METTSAAVMISLSLVVFGICYYYFTTRHKERMAIIEQGLSPDLFKGTVDYLPLILALGIVSIGIAIGIWVGAYISSLYYLADTYAIPICLFLFLGISLLIAYFMIKALHRRSKR